MHSTSKLMWDSINITDSVRFRARSIKTNPSPYPQWFHPAYGPAGLHP